MIDLNLIEEQVENFFEISGDDISSVINHGDSISFSHISLVEKNFSYEITITENGVMALTKQVPISSRSALDFDVSDSSTETLTEEVNVKESTASNIQDVIAFIMSI